MCGLAFNCICTSGPLAQHTMQSVSVSQHGWHMQPQKNGACNVSVRLQLFPLLPFEQATRRGGECWIENVYPLF